MKNTLMAALLLVGCSAGCVSLPRDGHLPGDADQSLSTMHRSTGPVTADQVEPGNAHRMAEAVWDEMDRDQERELTSTSSKKRPAP